MEAFPLFISGSHRRRKQFPVRWPVVELRRRRSEMPWRKERACIFKILLSFPGQLPIFGLIPVWACHTPSPMQYPLIPIFLLHPLDEKNLFSIGLWQLKPMHPTPILLSFSCMHTNQAYTLCFAKAPYILFVFV